MIARDVKAVYPALVKYHEDADLYNLEYAGIRVNSIKAVQELKKELIQKDAQLETVMQKNQELESRIARLEAMLDK